MVSPVFRYTAIVFNPDKQIISPEWKTEKKPSPISSLQDQRLHRDVAST